MNITPSYNVIQTLEKQMEAERQKRAEILLANAERDSTINLSEGERQLPSTCRRESVSGESTKQTGERRRSRYSPTPPLRGRPLPMPSTGRRQWAVHALLESYIGEVAKLFNEADVSVVPRELAQMEGFFEGIDQVSRTMNAGPRGLDHGRDIRVGGAGDSHRDDPVLLYRFFQAIRLVSTQTAHIVERLGKYQRTLDAGFHALIPSLIA